MVEYWKPKEIIVHNTVRDDTMTRHLLSQCPGVPVKFVNSGLGEVIKTTSDVLSDKKLETMLQKHLAGKQVVYIGPATSNVVDVFNMNDDRIMCPHFERLKLSYNGCYYACDWCYLKITCRAKQPFITVRAEYDKIKTMIQKRLNKSTGPIIFNTGEVADSLSLEHLTRAGQEFIPFFGQLKNGYMFMLTKSDNIDTILDLPHNGHTIIAWSINNAIISRKYEIGAPPLARRLEAAQKVQDAGYRLRLRIDPIVPFPRWQEAYFDTVKAIFEKVDPERITVGTLRFEKQFYNQRRTIFNTGNDLRDYAEFMTPMFPSVKQTSPTGKMKAVDSKYSFGVPERVDIFDFIVKEIRKYSDCPIALCKESPAVWDRVGLDISQCRCVCQYDTVDMKAKT